LLEVFSFFLILNSHFFSLSQIHAKSHPTYASIHWLTMVFFFAFQIYIAELQVYHYFACSLFSDCISASAFQLPERIRNWWKKRKTKGDPAFSYWHDEFLENVKIKKTVQQKDIRKLSTFSQKREETQQLEGSKSEERKLLDRCHDEEWLLAKLEKEANDIKAVERIVKAAEEMTLNDARKEMQQHAQLGQANYRSPWGYIATQNAKPAKWGDFYDSCFADADLFFDWSFYYSLLNDVTVDEAARLCTLVLCVIGTVCWFLVSTQFRPFIAQLDRFHLSHLAHYFRVTGFQLVFGLVFEDSLQLVNTALIKGVSTPAAALNIATGTFLLVLKLAKAKDNWKEMFHSENTTLGFFAQTNDVAKAKQLLKKSGGRGVDAKSGAHRPLVWACTKGHVEMVELLLENGAATEALDWEVCDMYVYCTMFIHIRITFPQNYSTPLHMGSEKGHADLV
jgi:hypothetical protein